MSASRGGRTAALAFALGVAAAVAAACAGSGAASSGSEAAPLSIPPLSPASASSASAEPAHAFRYELVLSGTEGQTTTRSAFSLDLSDEAPAAIDFGKNVRMGSTLNRSDVGTKLKSRLTFEGGTPRLDVEANISWIDAAGKGHRLKTEAGAETPPGVDAVIFDTNQDGRQLRLTATAKPVAPLGAGDSRDAGDRGETKQAYDADVVIAHGAGITTAKDSTLKLSLSGEEPTAVNTTENVPLGDGDAGTVPRFAIGTRVKASAHPRGAGVVLDFSFEASGLEANATIRKISVRGPVFAPLDRPTMAFSGEEDGRRYVVTVTPRRAR